MVKSEILPKINTFESLMKTDLNTFNDMVGLNIHIQAFEDMFSKNTPRITKKRCIYPNVRISAKLPIIPKLDKPADLLEISTYLTVRASIVQAHLNAV